MVSIEIYFKEAAKEALEQYLGNGSGMTKVKTQNGRYEFSAIHGLEGLVLSDIDEDLRDSKARKEPLDVCLKALEFGPMSCLSYQFEYLTKKQAIVFDQMLRYLERGDKHYFRMIIKGNDTVFDGFSPSVQVYRRKKVANSDRVDKQYKVIGSVSIEHPKLKEIYNSLQVDSVLPKEQVA